MLAGLLVSAALITGAAACGSDDGDDSGSGSQDVAANEGTGDDSSAGGSASSVGGTEPVDAKASAAEIKTIYSRFIDDIYDGRFERACSTYSTRYQPVYAKELGLARTCPATMKLEYSVALGDTRPKLIQVKFQGEDKAIGVSQVRAGGIKNPLIFVTENGEWKLEGSTKTKKATSGS